MPNRKRQTEVKTTKRGTLPMNRKGKMARSRRPTRAESYAASAKASKLATVDDHREVESQLSQLKGETKAIEEAIIEKNARGIAAMKDSLSLSDYLGNIVRLSRREMRALGAIPKAVTT
jgi:hypothetical protein